MPIYDFLCEDCGEAFEASAPSDPAAGGKREPCPACGSGAVSRQLVARIAVRTRAQRRGRVVDLSSGQCPGHGHLRR